MYMYETVGISERLASLCFESLGKAHKCHNHGVFIGHTYQRLTVCFLLMREIVQLYYDSRYT